MQTVGYAGEQLLSGGGAGGDGGGGDGGGGDGGGGDGGGGDGGGGDGGTTVVAGGLAGDAVGLGVRVGELIVSDSVHPNATANPTTRAASRYFISLL